LSDLKATYEHTKNPLFAWRALTLCDRGQPLPPWLMDYLLHCAESPPIVVENAEHRAQVLPGSGLVDMARDVASGAKSAAIATRAVGAALGLSRHSWNAFEAYKQIQADAAAAFAVKRGYPANKVDELYGTLRNVTPEGVRAGRRRAQRLWEAQRKAGD
jgi:hypothetical protein